MYFQMSFSAAAFARMIRYRVAEQFRPLAEPVGFPEKAHSWLDGMLVTEVELRRLPTDRVVIVNEIGPDGHSRPNPMLFGYHESIVTIDLALNVFFARVEDVAAAGIGDPPVQTLSIPQGSSSHYDSRGCRCHRRPADSHADRRAKTVGPTSAQGRRRPDCPLSEAHSFHSTLRTRSTMSLPPGSDRVLNAAITCDENHTVMLRFEFAGGDLRIGYRQGGAIGNTSPTAGASRNSAIRIGASTSMAAP